MKKELNTDSIFGLAVFCLIAVAHNGLKKLDRKESMFCFINDIKLKEKEFKYMTKKYIRNFSAEYKSSLYGVWLCAIAGSVMTLLALTSEQSP